MKFLALTGLKALDVAVKERLKGIEMFESVLSTEGLEEKVKSFQPDTILVSELVQLERIEDLLRDVRTYAPKANIVYVHKGVNKQDEDLFHQLGIHTVFSGSFTVSELQTAVGV